jgi:hypothetical protein
VVFEGTDQRNSIQEYLNLGIKNTGAYKRSLTFTEWIGLEPTTIPVENQEILIAET